MATIENLGIGEALDTGKPVRRAQWLSFYVDASGTPRSPLHEASWFVLDRMGTWYHYDAIEGVCGPLRGLRLLAEDFMAEDWMVLESGTVKEFLDYTGG